MPRPSDLGIPSRRLTHRRSWQVGVGQKCDHDFVARYGSAVPPAVLRCLDEHAVLDECSRVRRISRANGDHPVEAEAPRPDAARDDARPSRRINEIPSRHGAQSGLDAPLVIDTRDRADPSPAEDHRPGALRRLGQRLVEALTIEMPAVAATREGEVVPRKMSLPPGGAANVGGQVPLSLQIVVEAKISKQRERRRGDSLADALICSHGPFHDGNRPR